MTAAKINFCSSEAPDWKAQWQFVPVRNSLQKICYHKHSALKIYIPVQVGMNDQNARVKENDSEGWNTDSFKADIVGAAQPGQEGIPGRSYYGLSVLKER